MTKYSDITNRIRLLVRATPALILTLSTFVSLAQINNPTYDESYNVMLLGIKTHFGIVIGLNQSDFRVVNSPSLINHDSIFVVEPNFGPGFNLGIISDFKVGSHLNIRFIPSLLFAEKRLDYVLYNDSTTFQNIESIYIDLPLLLKFKSDRVSNFRVYVIGGAKYAIDMQSNARARNAPNKVKIEARDIAVEYGIGFDFYFPEFKMSPELKFSQGITNILVADSELIYADVLDKLFSRTITLSFHLE